MIKIEGEAAPRTRVPVLRLIREKDGDVTLETYYADNPAAPSPLFTFSETGSIRARYSEGDFWQRGAGYPLTHR